MEDWIVARSQNMQGQEGYGHDDLEILQDAEAR